MAVQLLLISESQITDILKIRITGGETKASFIHTVPENVVA